MRPRRVLPATVLLWCLSVLGPAMSPLPGPATSPLPGPAISSLPGSTASTLLSSAVSPFLGSTASTFLSSAVSPLPRPSVSTILGPVSTLLGPAPLSAQERIREYDSEIRILPDGGMEVTERIRVRAEGDQIRRGIYRDFPTRYRDRYGNRVRVDFEVIEVRRNGAPEPWFTEGRANGVRVNTGDDSFLPVPAEHTFEIRYRTSRQLGFFDEHDELYWNAIGTGWIFPIEAGTVEVRLPEPVSVEDMSAEGYTGPQGAQGSAYAAALPEPGLARYRLTDALGPGEGFTIVLTFPKGVIPEPTAGERARWLLADNRGVLIGLAGLIAFLLFTLRRWRAVGRDPEPGIIIARYEPPPGLTPAGARFLSRMSYDPRCFSGDLLTLAVKGHLHITREKSFLKDEWTLHAGPARNADPGDLDPRQQSLLRGLLPGGRGSLALKQSNAKRILAARQAHEAMLRKDFVPSHFQRHGKEVFFAVVILALTSILAFAGSGGFGIPLIILITVVMLIVLGIFAAAIPARTPKGRALLDEIEGLKLYLSVAEKQDLAQMRGPDSAGGESADGTLEASSGGDPRAGGETPDGQHARHARGSGTFRRNGDPPPLDAGRFEALLPFAVALEVEDAWTKKFTAAVGVEAAAAATSRIAWYHGPGTLTDMGSLTQALGSSLSSQIASSSSPPGSSSGSGGGGSSGGGGGGGGGGGR